MTFPRDLAEFARTGGSGGGGGTPAYIRSLKSFGAVGDGTTDDTVAVQAAFDWATTNRGGLAIDTGRYKLTASIVVAGSVYAVGAGMKESVFVSTITSGDAIRISPPATNQRATGCTLKDFGIEPAVALTGTGVTGLAVRLVSGAYFSNFLFQRLWIGEFSAYALLLDNNVGNADGFFRGVVEHSWLHNGVNGIKIGDSLTFQFNTVTGTRPNPGFLLTGLAGARQVVLRENNITTTGGAVALFSVEQGRLYENQMEHPGYLGSYNGPYSSLVYLSGCAYTQIIGNTIQPGFGTGFTKAQSAIRLAGGSSTKYNLIERNDIFLGSAYHIHIETGPVWTNQKNNTYSSAPVFQLDDQSRPQHHFPVKLTLRNGWVNWKGANVTHQWWDGLWLNLRDDGYAHIYGEFDNGGTPPTGDTSVCSLLNFMSVPTRTTFSTNSGGVVTESAVFAVFNNTLWPVATQVGANRWHSLNHLFKYEPVAYQ